MCEGKSHNLQSVNKKVITCWVCCSVNELLKMKEDLTKERDEQLQEISRLREQVGEANNLQQKLEQDKADSEEKIQEV